jgi:hypothetical protein
MYLPKYRMASSFAGSHSGSILPETKANKAFINMQFLLISIESGCTIKFLHSDPDWPPDSK